jgi:hypothetical protein
MESDKERIDQVTQQIVRFYHDNISAEEAIELMLDPNISAEFVERVYDQLSEAAEKSMTDRFHYYTIEVGTNSGVDFVSCWTSRYLLAYGYEFSDRAFHKIQIIDTFNDKSM